MSEKRPDREDAIETENGDDRPVAEQDPDPKNVYITETHAAILSDIVGHPFQLPTLPELVYTNRKHDKKAVKRSIHELLEEGLIEEVRFEDGSPHPRHPELFFGITDFGRSVLFSRMPEDNEENERKLHSVYAQAKKPEDIKRFERAPRPPRPNYGTDGGNHIGGTGSDDSS